MNTTDRTAFILGQLHAGLRTEWSQIEGLESNLEKLLHDARTRAGTHVPAPHLPEWDRSWSQVEEHLKVIRSSAAESRQRYDAGEPAGAVDSWNRVIEHDRNLELRLDEVRIIGREAVLPLGDSDPWYDSWKLLWMNIDEHLATLRAHAMATRFRLEMRDKFGAAQADALTGEILERLPHDASLEDAEKFAAEYRRAHHAFEEHRDHPTFRDILRGLFLLPEETPEDHLRQQREAEARRERLQKRASAGAAGGAA